MSKLPGAQKAMIDSSVSEEDVPTNAKIVSNQLKSVDNTSIDLTHNINRNIIKLPKIGNSLQKTKRHKTKQNNQSRKDKQDKN